MVRTGFSEDIGSWKIMASRFPRSFRSWSSSWPSSSSPSKTMEPEVLAAGLGRSPSTASELTLLPLPDSPTIPIVSPAPRS